MDLVTRRKQILTLRAHAKSLEVVARRRDETGNPFLGAPLVHHILALDEKRLEADCTPERMSEAFEAIR